jgi:hypothetical protein
MAGASLNDYEVSLTVDDKAKLSALKVPVPLDEGDRIEILRRSQLLDSDTNDFDRYTALAKRLISVSSITVF